MKCYATLDLSCSKLEPIQIQMRTNPNSSQPTSASFHTLSNSTSESASQMNGPLAPRFPSLPFYSTRLLGPVSFFPCRTTANFCFALEHSRYQPCISPFWPVFAGTSGNVNDKHNFFLENPTDAPPFCAPAHCSLFFPSSSPCAFARCWVVPMMICFLFQLWNNLFKPHSHVPRPMLIMFFPFCMSFSTSPWNR